MSTHLQNTSYGIITNYRVGSKEYSVSVPRDEVDMTEVGPERRRMLLANQNQAASYVVEIQAQTSKGCGEGVRKTTRTVKWAGKLDHFDITTKKDYLSTSPRRH